MTLLPTILQATGISIIALATSLVYAPAGLFIVGVGVLLFGLAWERKGK
jgi:hypothetical protein